MKRNISSLILLIVSLVAKAQTKDSIQILKAKETPFKISYVSPFKEIPKNNALKMNNPNIDKASVFPQNYTQKVESDIQKNLNQLNTKFSVNPYQIQKTQVNPNGAATPKQAIISGLIKGISK